MLIQITEDMKIDQVVIGSCTNGRIDDMRIAAEVLKGRHVAKGMRCIVIPATQAIYMQAMENTVFILFIPYLISILFFSYQEKTAKLRELMDENIGFKSSTLISFRDERGVLQLSVAKENLLYIESADNYICIWYTHLGGNRYRTYSRQLYGLY